MSPTQEYEYLLECENVIGVDYDADEDRVTAFVSQKRPSDCLDDADDVEKRVAEAGDDAEVSVVDSGYDEEREGFDALSVLEAVPEAAQGRQDRHRPVPGGVSEINAYSTAGTGGPYPARVADPDAGTATWADDVASGDLVRLSNNHVYARSNAADLGEPILQPSPEDGGDSDDAVGDLVGYVPIEDGELVDVAARSVDPERESDAYYELDEAWPTGVRREDYADLRGETVTKTGRTTGVTSADIEATSASVRVDFGDQGTVLFRDQLVAGPLSEPGDSGSPVFLENGDLVGLLFAGSARQTICNRIANVERELGVEVLTAEPDDAGEDAGTDDATVYPTTMEHTVSIDVDAQSPTLESLTFEDELEPGETVDVVATVAGDPGEYWLAVGGERTTVTIAAEDDGAGAGDRDEDEDGDEDGTAGRTTATLAVPIPDDAAAAVTLEIRGGPTATLE